MSIKERLRKYLPKNLWNILQVLNTNWLKFKFKYINRPYIAGETTKAYSRRKQEGFFERYCNGKGLDIGFGGDLIIKDAKGFDFEHGDAQYLTNISDNTYDFVYSSHTIEHLPNPDVAIKNWFRVLRPNGFLIIYAPHRDLYEKKKTLPSRFNPTHLHFFLPDKDEEPDTIGIRRLIEKSLTNYELIYIKVCYEGFSITDPYIHSDGEYSIEVVLKKL
jgi:SAM-dependent methyltransferase